MPTAPTVAATLDALAPLVRDWEAALPVETGNAERARLLVERLRAHAARDAELGARLSPALEAAFIDRVLRHAEWRRRHDRARAQRRPARRWARTLARLARGYPWVALAACLHLLLALAAFAWVFPADEEPPPPHLVLLSLPDSDAARPTPEEPLAPLDPPERPADPLDPLPVPQLPATIAPPEPPLVPLPELAPADFPLPPAVAAPAAPVDSGVGAGAAAPAPEEAAGDPFAARRGAAKQAALARHGGSAAGEAAAQEGLDWLARHQVRQGALKGMWLGRRFARQCPPNDRCPGEQSAQTAPADVGLTALALLAFLGAGHTPAGGPYADTVALALAALRACQQDDGAIDERGLARRLRGEQEVAFEWGRDFDPNQLYHHAIATLALGEAAALTGDAALRPPLARAVAFLATTQQRSGGWNYAAAYADDRSDTSITGWVLLALRAAAAGGEPAAPAVLERTARFFRRVSTGTAGEFRYATRDTTWAPPDEPNRRVTLGGPARRTGNGMAAVGLLGLLLTGEAPDSAAARAGRARLLADPPDWEKLARPRGPEEYFHSMYYWYYATLALFLVGGDDWRRWNEAAAPLWIARQRRQGHARGSWDPDGAWLGPHGGRIYATALGALCLEVYYRYPPLAVGGTGTAPPERPAFTLATALAAARAADGRARQVEAMEWLGVQGGAEGLAALGALARADNDFVRWKAIEVLAQSGVPGAVAPLCEALRDPGNRRWAARAADGLAAIGGDEALDGLIALLEAAPPDEQRTEHVVRALRRLSGQSFGADAALWRRWRAGRGR